MHTDDDMADAGWISASAALQRIAAARTGRTDLVVRLSPALDRDPAAWSGLYRHDLAEIRLPAGALLDGDVAPRDLDLTARSGRLAQARLAGAVALATAHAAHTTWARPPGLDAAVATATDLLEQLRVIRVHLGRHPGDRRWLRAAASELGTAGRTSATWLAVTTVGLRFAGVLDAEEAAPAAGALAAALPADGAEQVRAVLADVITFPDDAGPALRDQAQRLAGLLGTPSPDPDEPQGPPLTRDLRAALETLPVHDARRERPRQSIPRDEDLELAEREFARAAARDTFDAPDESGVLHREPTPELYRAARRLAGALRRARYRAAAVTLEPHEQPPGRLRLAEAMRRQAQREAGTEATARPWLRIRRHETDLPPLRVGLSWDISRSQSPLHSRMAELAWALSWAMRQVDGTLAAVAWNSRTHAVQWPGRVPSEVVEPPCRGSSTACPQSLRALDGALDLHSQIGARVVIVATDGHLPNRAAVRAEIGRLARLGVSVLWVTPLPDPRTPGGAVNLAASDPDTLVATLGDAVCRILARTQT